MHVMISYRVKRGRVEQNLELLERVYAELRAAPLTGLRYASFRLADGVSFLDLVETDGPGRFSQLRSFREFRSGLDERCEEPPVLTDLCAIDSYDFD